MQWQTISLQQQISRQVKPCLIRTVSAAMPLAMVGMVAQVRACNTNLNLQWFEEDEMNTSAYLNEQYYKFEE